MHILSIRIHRNSRLFMPRKKDILWQTNCHIPTFADQIIDSKELDYAASLKYEWNRRFKTVNSNLKAGVQWKATGNVGEGEYYKDPSLAPNGYRPPLHRLSIYA